MNRYDSYVILQLELDFMIMPNDKFGRHMLASAKTPYGIPDLKAPTLTSTSNSFYECQPIKYSSECVLYINGHYDERKNLSRCILTNRDIEYISPLSGKIKKLIVVPNAKVFLNGKYFEISGIKSLNVGDKLTFVRDEVIYDIPICRNCFIVSAS